MQNFLQRDFDRLVAVRDANNHKSTTKSELAVNSRANYDEPGAALFVVVVILFYSMSVACMIISNVKFKCVMYRRPGVGTCGLVWCKSRGSQEAAADLYEAQATKETIHMLFNHSARVLSSVAIADSHGLASASAISGCSSNGAASQTKRVGFVVEGQVDGSDLKRGGSSSNLELLDPLEFVVVKPL
jgi:hypothetical protein